LLGRARLGAHVPRHGLALFKNHPPVAAHRMHRVDYRYRQVGSAALPFPDWGPVLPLRYYIPPTIVRAIS
ncbi:hypothetical protein DXG03_002461, partial [Asterophora parasitica]